MTTDRGPRGAGQRRNFDPPLETLASVPNSYKDVRPGTAFSGWLGVHPCQCAEIYL
jgi:hypothetical protein